MKSNKFWIAVLVGGVVANILDFLVQGMWLEAAYYSKMPDLFNMGTNVAYYIIGDFVFVFVLAWVYDKVASSFVNGSKGGMTFGLYAGVLLNFPMWIFIHLMIKNFPYGLAWINIIYGIIWTIVIGTVLGGFLKKTEAAPAA
ncbi:MAG: hypothetical protein KGJ59_06990 [Bacteroidota bacterium]|nr:hypothetical protein [Bacteroidota bacterium]